MALEIAGLVLGVAGLVGTLTGCLDLWEDISDGLRVSDDINSFIRQVSWVQLQFIAWCAQTDLWELVNAIQSDPKHGRPIQAPTDVDRLIPSQPVEILVQKCLEQNIRALHKYLGDTKKFLESYGACGTPRVRNVLKKRRPVSAMVHATQVARTVEEKKREHGAWDVMRWGTAGFRESKRLLEELKSCLAPLQGILELVNAQQASSATRMSQAMATTTSFGRAIVEEEAFASGQTRYESDRALVALSQMSQRARGIRERAEDDDDDDTVVQLRGLNLVGSGDSLELRSADFDLPLDDNTSPPEREVVTHADQQVLVEWRYYSSRLSPVDRDLLHHRIALLVQQLRQSSSFVDFRVPPCLGFFSSPNHSRYGIVFPVPKTSTPVTLWDVIVDDRYNHKSRDLDARFRLARSLVLSIFRFFSVGWLHKNIRSSSVVFLDAPTSGFGLPDAYLCGFGFARKETSTAVTELNPSQLHGVQKSRNWRLYCHPERYQALSIEGTGDAPASTLSNMRYDAYGLGVILLEIALWCPVAKLCKKEETVESFQGGLAKNTSAPIQCSMGEGYAHIVRRLLEGDFGEEGQEESGVEARSLTFLAAFEKTVVAAMESLAHR